ncbi:hypothetical protein J6590_041653 [Homalodisca vitripennis]|nr:hypothetical protein J6590_041653 [Homalodisca vitripennis]
MAMDTLGGIWPRQPAASISPCLHNPPDPLSIFASPSPPGPSSDFWVYLEVFFQLEEEAMIYTDTRKELRSAFEPNNLEQQRLNVSLLKLGSNSLTLASSWRTLGHKIKNGNLLMEDGTEVANQFNEIFTSVAVGQGPQPSEPIIRPSRRQSPAALMLLTLIEDELHRIIQQLPAKK